MITRELVTQYLTQHEDRGEAIAALIEDYPELEEQNSFHKVPNILVLLEDLSTYRGS